MNWLFAQIGRMRPFKRKSARRQIGNMFGKRGMMMSMFALAVGGAALSLAKKRGMSGLKPMMNRMFGQTSG
mgnify:CR=1 FL=1